MDFSVLFFKLTHVQKGGGGPFTAIVNQDTSTARYTQLRLEHITLKQFLPTILHPKPLLRERTSLWVSPGTITIYMGITSISYAMALANHNSAVY